MRNIVKLLLFISCSLATTSAWAETCSGLINYVEVGGLYGIQLKGVDKGHTLTIAKVDKQNCVLAVTKGKGDIILLDANSIAVLTKQK